MARRPQGVLRRGWTTVAFAAAAARAAYQALLSGELTEIEASQAVLGEKFSSAATVQGTQ